MKIATFNINGIKARLPRLTEWLAETRPAVACLQEIKSPDETFPGKEIEALGYHVLTHGQKAFNGVAVLTDGKAGFEPPREVRRGLGIDGPKDGEGEQARYLEVEATPGRDRNSTTSSPGWKPCARAWQRSGRKRSRQWCWAISTSFPRTTMSGR